jgi:hypothetical protein
VRYPYFGTSLPALTLWKGVGMCQVGEDFEADE